LAFITLIFPIALNLRTKKFDRVMHKIVLLAFLVKTAHSVPFAVINAVFLAAVNHIIEFKIYRIDNIERKIYRMIKFIERKYIELYNIERIIIE
jgi:hypothetical protein